MQNFTTWIRDFINGKRVDESSPRPFLFDIRSSKLYILSTICMAVFTDIFLYGIIIPVVPFALTSRVGVPEEDVQHWVSVLLAVYGGAMLLGSPVAGWFADNSDSRRGPLLFGLLCLAGATVMLCLAKTVALLVVGRILQGLSASIVWSVGLALLVDTVGQMEIGETLGYVSFSMTIASMVAPLVGGVTYQRVGYYPVYYICFGFIALDIFLRLTLIEKRIALQWINDAVVDADSPVTLSNEAVDPEKAIIRQAVTLETAACQPSISSTSESAADVRKTMPFIQLIKSRRLNAALWGTVVYATTVTAIDTTLPLFVQDRFGWDSIGAGLIFICLIIPAFFAPLVGWVSDNVGARWLVVGSFLASVPVWVCLRFVVENTLRQKVLLCALLVLLGFTSDMAVGPLLAEITYVVEAKEKKSPGLFGKNGAYAQAYALFTMAFSAGTLIGPFWGGYIEVAAGWATMVWTLAVLSVCGAVPALIWTGGLITRENAKTGEERALGRRIKP